MKQQFSSGCAPSRPIQPKDVEEEEEELDDGEDEHANGKWAGATPKAMAAREKEADRVCDDADDEEDVDARVVDKHVRGFI